MPIVDLIISTRNDNDSALINTLHSIDKSNFLDFRVLLVNDSNKIIPDNILVNSLVEVVVIDNHESLGLTYSLIFAISYSNAKYIARADVGDILHPARIEEQVNYMESNPLCVVLGCSTRIWVKSHKRNLIDAGSSFYSKNSKEIKKMLLKTNPFVHGSIMIRASAYQESGGYDGNVKVAQDFNLYIRMAPLGELAILQRVLSQHTFDLSNSTTFVKNKKSIFSALKSRLKYFSLKDKLSKFFIYGVLRDLILLMLPLKVLFKLRVYLITRNKV
ncbi:hypothetical protein [uncultured Gammaproteobacteria bacterium]|nr:hypothetical protein [uncultured Gammaproteobacteria bacterium]